MKKKYLSIIFIVFIFNNFYSQTNNEQDFVSRQNWFKKSINVIYKNNETNLIKYSCYFKNDELYVTCEYKSDLYSSDFEQLNSDIRNIAKEMIYKMAEILTMNEGGLIINFKENFNTRYINFIFSTLTKDFKNHDIQYYVEANDLYKISSYYNKGDFFQILK